MSGKFILDDNGNPVECDDIQTWGRWMETGDRKVAFTQLGDVKVSTVFLGLDHSFGNGAPVLFETMVFGGALDGEQDRYRTREDAHNGHTAMVKRVVGAQC